MAPINTNICKNTFQSSEIVPLNGIGKSELKDNECSMEAF